MGDKVITAGAQGESPALPWASWVNSERMENESPFTQGFGMGGFVLALPVLGV